MSIVEGVDPTARLAAARASRPGTGSLWLWLWWRGDEKSRVDLDRVWRAYIRRFDIEHTFRFAEQSAGLDHAEATQPGAGRPVDLAGHLTECRSLGCGELRCATPALNGSLCTHVTSAAVRPAEDQLSLSLLTGHIDRAGRLTVMRVIA
jgi:hypothetical protein